jgi:hypothetical protein
MNFKTFIAPVAALALVIGGVTLSAPEAKAQWQGTTNYRVNQRVNGFRVRNNNTGSYTNYTNRVGGGYRYNNSNGSYGNIRYRNY